MTIATTLPDARGRFGTYGGRYVLGETSGPKTFNAMMANETSSTDITGNMFVGLADFDNETQEDATCRRC